MKRPRKYITLPDRLAAALACLLPQDERARLRAEQVPAKVVIALFHFDHLHLHTFGGSDKWFNLDPKLVAVHREKSRRDTSIAAKAVRIDEKWQEFHRIMAAGRKKWTSPPKRKSAWPSKKFGRK